MAGYLYNYQSKEFYNLSFALQVPEVPAKFGGLLIYPSIGSVQHSSFEETVLRVYFC
jgi:hypothetical protein